MKHIRATNYLLTKDIIIKYVAKSESNIFQPPISNQSFVQVYWFFFDSDIFLGLNVYRSVQVDWFFLDGYIIVFSLNVYRGVNRISAC